MNDDTSLRPRPGETAEQTVERVVSAIRKRTMTADTITIESDERGFELHVETDEGERFVFNIQGCAEEVLDAAKKEIGPWVAEMHSMKAEYERTRAEPTDDLDDGPWAGETPLAFYQRTGDDGPLRELGDELRARAKA